MQLRRRTTLVEAPMSTMDTSLIKPFEQLPTRRTAEASPLISAVLFASGKLVEVNTSEVFGLVLAGYEGLLFGDDGTFTARVASELPLEKHAGTRTLEGYINEAVQSVNPAYVAEHVGYCVPEEASVYLRAQIKQAHGEPVQEGELSWPSGHLTLWQPTADSTTGAL